MEDERNVKKKTAHRQGGLFHALGTVPALFHLYC
jgi:hypothetical protein